MIAALRRHLQLTLNGLANTMPSRRYYIAKAPIEHINGKMAPVRQKCKNVQNESEAVQEGYMYGYTRFPRPDISRYAYRDRGRVLSAHPYTSREYDLQYYFSRGVYYYKRYRDTQPNNRWTALQNAFAAQCQYSTAYTLCIAKVIQNRGSWPAEWT